MYLSELRAINFRCLKDIAFEFQPGLNVILGENNTGKSALMDALRIVLGMGSTRRELYASEFDFHHDGNGKATCDSFEIHATFRSLSTEEQGLFSVCLCPSLGGGVAQVHIRFSRLQQGQRVRFHFSAWGGEHEGEPIPSEVLEGIRVVYLAALRDVQVGLRPGRGSRISRLLQLLAAGEDERTRLEKIVGDANQAIEGDALIARARTEVNRRLRDVTGRFMAQAADLRLSPPEFRRITESLRALIGSKQPLELEENGLGYNNLLYIATVLGELQQAKAADEIDLAVLLIEEPEAHLHPHLQVNLMDYLERVSSSPAKPPTGARSEERARAVSSGGELTTAEVQIPIQVFVTSHSPILASQASLSSVNVLHFGRATGDIKSYALAKCPLDEDDRKFLRRFLDVTKAQLFFAKGVLLVEGVSEALLLPEIARMMGFPLDERGVSVVNVQSLAFPPFAALFGASGIDVPAALLTDGDPPEDVFPTAFDPSAVSATAKQLQQLEGGTLKVYIAAKTLEYDLALAGNAPRMTDVYAGLRPEKGRNMQTAVSRAQTPCDQAKAWWEHFDKDDKARFAQRLAEALATKADGFKIPVYLANAVRHAVGDANANTP